MDKDRSIIAQSAGKDATEIVKALIGVGEVALDSAFDVYETLKTDIFNSTLALAGAQSVVERFEGGPSYSEPTSASSGGGRPHADVEVKMGKFRGKTIGQIDAEPEGHDWLEWAAESISNDWLKGRIREYLAA